MSSHIGSRLKQARELAELSARELGRLAGLSGTAPALIELGLRSNVGVDTVARLARVLGVTTDWLILGSGPAPSKATCLAAAKRARRTAA